VKKLLFAVLAVTWAACSQRGAGSTAPHQLVIADWSEPSSIDPLLAHDQDTIGFDLLFVQTLVGLSKENRLIPILVTRVPSRANGDISSDGRTIVYHLRPGIRFADGAPLTSRDVAFTFRAIMDPRNPVLSSDAYRRVAALATPDAHTVVVRLRAPWNAAVRELFAQSDFAFGILPAHAFTGTDVVHAPWEEHAFGSGPFRVVQWRRGDRIILEPNPYYSPHPKLVRLELRMIPDLNSVVVVLRTGEAQLARIGAGNIPSIAAIPGMRVVATPVNGSDYLTLQTTGPPTDELGVRRALAEAIDTKSIAKMFFGRYVPGGAFLPPVFPWHDAALAPIAHNDAGAAAQLDAAGWHLRDGVREKNGKPLELTIVEAGRTTSTFATLVQRQLETDGIRATIRFYAPSAFNGPNGPLRTGKFNIAAQGWIGGADPEQSVTFACSQIGADGNNISRFCDRRFEAAFADQAVTPDDKLRAADFQTLQQIVYRELPTLPLDYLEYYDAVSDRVSGFSRNMLGFPVDAEKWDVK
jgi:peptide/nickel transport system substrate-binding protein